jgi:hypothetical protein
MFSFITTKELEKEHPPKLPRPNTAVEKSGVSTIENHPASGYSIVKASSLDEAVDLAKGCPILEEPAGAVRVYETLPM